MAHENTLVERRNSISSKSSLTNADGSFDIDDLPIARQVPLGELGNVDVKVWGVENAGFIRSPSGLSEQWIGRRSLGEGGFGVAGLWEKVDGNGRMIDQMVVKQIKGGSRKQWKPRMPKEAKIMHRMNKVGCSAVVRLIAYRRYTRRQVHRLYLEYCPHGDLKGLLTRYRRFGRYFPEAFIWEVFHHLVEAAAAMQIKPEGPHQNFEIVHMDIKPANIFLGDPSVEEGNIPFYPTAKLGDWGIAERLEPADPDNPERYKEAGTDKYMAPEQQGDFQKSRPHQSEQSWRISSHTNVWAIGAVMYELVTLSKVYAVYLRNVKEHKEGINPIEVDPSFEYSKNPREIIRECLRPKTHNQPNISRLRIVINEHRKVAREKVLTEDATPKAGHRLYYVGNEINDMTPGEWRPNRESDRVESPNKSEEFRDLALSPLRFPKPAPEAGTSKERNENKPVKDKKKRKPPEWANWDSCSKLESQVAGNLSDGGDDDNDGRGDALPKKRHITIRDTDEEDDVSSKRRRQAGRSFNLHLNPSDSGVGESTAIREEQEQLAARAAANREDQTITRNRMGRQGPERHEIIDLITKSGSSGDTGKVKHKEQSWRQGRNAKDEKSKMAEERERLDQEYSDEESDEGESDEEEIDGMPVQALREQGLDSEEIQALREHVYSPQEPASEEEDEDLPSSEEHQQSKTPTPSQPPHEDSPNKPSQPNSALHTTPSTQSQSLSHNDEDEEEEIEEVEESERNEEEDQEEEVNEVEESEENESEEDQDEEEEQHPGTETESSDPRTLPPPRRSDEDPSYIDESDTDDDEPSVTPGRRRGRVL